MRTIKLLISDDDMFLGAMSISILSTRGENMELMVSANASEATFIAMNDALGIIHSAFEVLSTTDGEIKYAS